MVLKHVAWWKLDRRLSTSELNWSCEPCRGKNKCIASARVQSPYQGVKRGINNFQTTKANSCVTRYHSIKKNNYASACSFHSYNFHEKQQNGSEKSFAATIDSWFLIIKISVDNVYNRYSRHLGQRSLLEIFVLVSGLLNLWFSHHTMHRLFAHCVM